MNHKFKNRKHTISFRRALEGIILAYKTQPNLKIMIIFALLVFLLSHFLRLNYLEWVVIVWTVVIVFIAEMINTSIESMVDLITTEWREDAKIAKDVSSGMVLMAVIGSIMVGVLIFAPKILSYLGRLSYLR